jgi:DNA repair and recombination RAD54-like protein
MTRPRESINARRAVGVCLVDSPFIAFTFMLKRRPTTSDGKVLDRLQESVRVNLPFKAPTRSKSLGREQPQRKRKRVSYAGQQADADSDSDGSSKKKKKKNDKDVNYNNEDELLARQKQYPVFKPKGFDQVINRRFSLPSIQSKDGSFLMPAFSNIALGIRPLAKVIPRPLHDPMEDHAIVLFDPTIDDRETDEERKEREAEELKARAEEEARTKNAGMYNPHKSLRKLLGEGGPKEKTPKVPVVIDPRLSKVLRPHQVEGVQVSCYLIV